MWFTDYKQLQFFNMVLIEKTQTLQILAPDFGDFCRFLVIFGIILFYKNAYYKLSKFQVP